MVVYLNGKFVPESRASISVHDLGFLYGDGIFETLRAYNGAIFRVNDHLARLEESARRIRLAIPHSRRQLGRILEKTLARNRARNALLRLTVTRGIGPWGEDPRPHRRPAVVVLVRRFSGLSESAYLKGQKAAISSQHKHTKYCLDPRIKSLNFLSNRLAREEARRRGFDEALLLNPEGDLAEGSVSNLFLVQKGRLLTPPARSGILLGVTRGVVLRIARRLRISIRETRLRREHLAKADECFLTGTSIEIMPVHHVGNVKIGTGKPGPVTMRLHDEFRKLVREECSS